MVRKIITIDENLCNGCGACAAACHEGAIRMVDSKARLIRDDYCDGLGDCLPACPVNAITFVQREASAYDAKAVAAAKTDKAEKNAALPCGCLGTRSKRLRPEFSTGRENATRESGAGESDSAPSALLQWPVQIKLLPVNAPYFENADVLVAADCAAYACGNFHTAFMRGRVTMIGCPKLDEGDYTEKLTAIFTLNNIKSVTVARMEVPCCGGLENAVKRALLQSGKVLPLNIVVIHTDGSVTKAV